MTIVVIDLLSTLIQAAVRGRWQVVAQWHKGEAETENKLAVVIFISAVWQQS